MGGPSFIQIINNYHVQQEEIRIPQEFVTEYGDDLFDHVGLNELFESYSITSGTFLVLKYEEISQFKVRICQLSDEDGDNDDSEDDKNDEEREEFRDDPMRKKNRSITHGGLRTQEREIEIERGFKSSRNNLFFAIGLQPSYVSHKFLPIPANFEGKEELRKLENIRLDVVPNGGSWIVFLITMGRGQGIRFSKGVPRFLKDNNLKEGDMTEFLSCSFQEEKQLKMSLTDAVLSAFNKYFSSHSVMVESAVAMGLTHSALSQFCINILLYLARSYHSLGFLQDTYVVVRLSDGHSILLAATFWSVIKIFSCQHLPWFVQSRWSIICSRDLI
ncbi:hypothetical protein MKX03_036069 [Papaver bracteatum]|nr:hypothetical protein MKX03_036069 [Papaver bracteatum]